MKMETCRRAECDSNGCQGFDSFRFDTFAAQIVTENGCVECDYRKSSSDMATDMWIIV